MAILDNLDAIKDKATEVASTAVKKTKKLAIISKTNIALLSLEDKIKRAYKELGKLYYRDYAVDEDRDEAEYLPWCMKIDEAKQTIDQKHAYGVENLLADVYDLPCVLQSFAHIRSPLLFRLQPRSFPWRLQ